MMQNKEYLRESFEKAKIEISDSQCDKLILFYEMLIKTNRVMNLTSITDFKEVVHKHFIDSVYPIRLIPNMTQMSYSVIDVGTGAGFPGIPISIVYPELRLTLLDSLNKRVGFLNSVINELKLDNSIAIHGRAEDVAREPEHRESYDIAVSRAVARMNVLSEYVLPFVKINGEFMAYKTSSSSTEKNTSDDDQTNELAEAKYAIETLGGDPDNIFSLKYSIEGFDNDREVFVINKIGTTSDRFPRRANAIDKKPLRR